MIETAHPQHAERCHTAAVLNIYLKQMRRLQSSVHDLNLPATQLCGGIIVVYNENYHFSLSVTLATGFFRIYEVGTRSGRMLK